MSMYQAIQISTNIEPNHTKDIKKQFEFNKAFNISQKSEDSIPFLNLFYSLFYGIFKTVLLMA